MNGFVRVAHRLLVVVPTFMVQEAAAQEDCANQLDDDAQAGADCEDPACNADPACDPCFTRWSFDSGPGGWIATDNSAAAIFQHGTSALHGEAGWATGLDVDLNTLDTVTTPLRAQLRRSLTVPVTLPQRQVELVVSFEGNGSSSWGVCFNVAPSACFSGSGNTTYESTATTTNEVVLLPIPVGNVDVVVMYDSVGSPATLDGLFVASIALLSDWDGDGLAEGADASCDHCVDADEDGYGANLAYDGTSGCVVTTPDCDDNAGARFPGAAELCDGTDNDCDSDTADGSGEAWIGMACDGPDSDACLEGSFECEAGVLQCNDTSTDTLEVCDGADNDCSGYADDADALCGAGEQCDDGWCVSIDAGGSSGTPGIGGSGSGGSSSGGSQTGGSTHTSGTRATGDGGVGAGGTSSNSSGSEMNDGGSGATGDGNAGANGEAESSGSATAPSSGDDRSRPSSRKHTGCRFHAAGSSPASDSPLAYLLLLGLALLRHRREG